MAEASQDRLKTWVFGPPGQPALFELREERTLLAGGTLVPLKPSATRVLVRLLAQAKKDPLVGVTNGVDRDPWLARHTHSLRDAIRPHRQTNDFAQYNHDINGWSLGSGWVVELRRPVAVSPAEASRGGEAPASVFPSVHGRLHRLSNVFVGRTREIRLLERSCQSGGSGIAICHALGGGGKTAMVDEWLTQVMRSPGRPPRLLVHSFREQGDAGHTTSDAFFGQARAALRRRAAWPADDQERGRQLARLARREPTVIVLDGLEALQLHSDVAAPAFGRVQDVALWSFLTHWSMATDNGEGSLCVITTRYMPPAFELKRLGTGITEIDLDALSEDEGEDLLLGLGVVDHDGIVKRVARSYHGHCLSLTLVGQLLVRLRGQDVRRIDLLGPLLSHTWSDTGQAVRAVMTAYHRLFAGTPEEIVLQVLALFDRPVTPDLVELLRHLSGPIGDSVRALPRSQWTGAVASLASFSMASKSDTDGGIDTHPIIREYVREQMADDPAWPSAHQQLYRKFLDASPRPTQHNRGEGHYRAAWHGIKGGCHVEVFRDVYQAVLAEDPDRPRSIGELGTVAEDLSLLIGLFERPWILLPGFDDADARHIYKQTAYALRRMGRLDDARDCGDAALQRLRNAGNWESAARTAENLHETELVQGNLDAARALATAALECAQTFRASAGEAQRDKADMLVEQLYRKVAVVDAFLGQGARALVALRAGRSTRARLWRTGQPEWKAMVVYHWAYVLESRGRLPRGSRIAERVYDELCRISSVTTHITGMLQGVVGRMRLEAQADVSLPAQLQRARIELQESAKTLTTFRKHVGVSRALTALATMHIAGGAFDKARAALAKAEDECVGASIALFDAERLYVKALLAFAEGDPRQGQALAAHARRKPGAPMFAALARSVHTIGDAPASAARKTSPARKG